MPVFKGSKNFYDYEITDILSYNIQRWLDYGLLEKGAYTVARFDLPTSGLCTLQRTYDNRLGGHGRVFEGMGPSWVWETDISVPSGYIQPFPVSGIYINDVYYSSSSPGPYEHYIDYRTGRVVFASGLPANMTVKCEYVFKNVDVFIADSYQWRTLQDEYWRRYLNLEDVSPSGMASILKDRRVWLPCVGIKAFNMTSDGLQLGGGEIADCEVEYHVFSDRAFSRNRLADMITNQREANIDMFDINRSPMPYNRNGSLASGAMTYPQLSDRNGPYFWTYSYIRESEARSTGDDFDLYRAEISQSVSVYRYLSTY